MIVKTTHEHFLKLDLREHEKNFHASTTDLSSFVSHMIEKDCAWTLVGKSEVLTIVGFLELLPGTYELWQLPSVHIPSDSFTYSRSLADLFEYEASKIKPRRVQSHCLKDGINGRWMKFLGFEKEGLLKAYGPGGEDYEIFGRVFKWE